MTVAYIPKDLNGLTFVEQASFAAGDPGSGYDEIKAWDIKFDPSITMHANPYQKAEACRGPDPSIVGGYGGTLSFKTHLRGGNSAVSQFIELAQYMGASKRTNYAGTNVITSGSTSTAVGTDANMSGYAVGDGLYSINTSTLTMRFVSKEVSAAGSTTLTMEPNATVAYANLDDIYGTNTLVPALGEPSKYLTFKVYNGATSSDNCWTCSGCAGTWKLATVAATGLPVIEWTYQVDYWTLTTAALTTSTDDYNPAAPVLGDSFFMDNTAVKVSDVSFDPGLQLVPLVATSGSQGRAGWLYAGTVPKVSFTPYWDTAHVTAWAAATTYQICFESIKDSEDAWGFYLPKVQIVKVGTDGDISGHLAAKMDFVALDPGYNDESSPKAIPLWSFCVTGLAAAP